VLASGGAAGATVSATLTACRLTPTPIRVMATGGIGGVHVGWTQRPDVSVDLRELARTPALVVCSGAKSILDLPATLEMLEALGVPVIGDGTDHLPRFLAAGDERLRVTQRIDDVTTLATLAARRWVTLRQPGAVLVTRNPPADTALDAATLDAALQAADDEATSDAGAARTPHLLATVARLSGDRSVRANIGLLLDNARRAAEVAVAVARDPVLRAAGPSLS
ncbi:MAG: pseudouridine-5'-phosphate glycosidase, partial [Phycisphaerae bacterium]|nr:pseudouridine-5'-phosphate glycosidase [Phycisphaerae bacterium]